MKIKVKGHSGCRIDVVPDGNDIYVYKSTSDPKYLKRLTLQAEKQQTAASVDYQHIRVPKILDIENTSETVIVKMQYIYSKNFIEFFEQAGFEQIDYLIVALKSFIEYEIGQSKLQTVPSSIFHNKFTEIKGKVETNPLYKGDQVVSDIIHRSELIFSLLPSTISLPVGLCHGDLTFSNILFNGNNYFLIDFLDNFIETPLQDIVKIRQDTAFHWSQLMYTKRYDAVRLRIICEKIDREIDSYFNNKYQWYRDYFQMMQLMNILRIMPYAQEEKVVVYLKKVLTQILDTIVEPSNQQDEQLMVPLDKATLPKKHTLLVPVAADKPEYNNGLPYVFGLDKDGIIICLKSIMGLDLGQFDDIFFTILKKHDELFFISDLLKLQFKRLGVKNAKVVVLEEPTVDQAETIYNTIQKEQIEGSIFIKDADSYFKSKMKDANGIAICPIEDLEILTPKDKSYVAIDDMYYITNIIEKAVVGHYISAGGYAFKNTASFCTYYRRLRGCGKLYLSHIIYNMLLEKKTFRPMIIEDYKDWGTAKDWSRNE